MNMKLKVFFEDNNIIFIQSFNVNAHFNIDLKKMYIFNKFFFLFFKFL